MSAFGHAGFGSSNRRNQLRAQGQIGGDQYGQGVRSAMQAPTFNIYQTPSTYQQATGTQTQQPAQPQSPPQSPVTQPQQPPPTSPFPTDTPGQPAVQPPGTAQPIPPQSQGTPHTNAPQKPSAASRVIDKRTPYGDAVSNAQEAMDALVKLGIGRQTWDGSHAEFYDARQKYLEDSLAKYGGGDWRQGVRDYYTGLITDTTNARDSWSQWGDANKGGTGGGLSAGLSSYDRLIQQYNDQLDAFNQSNPQTGGGYPLPNPQTGGGYPLPTNLPTFGDDMHTYAGPVSSPGTAQPIPPQSQGTPYSPTPSDRYNETNEERMSRPYLLPGESQPMTYQQRLETARPGAVESAAQEWNSTPAGSQKRDWEGDTVRSMLKGGLSPDMAANVLLNTGRFAGNPTGARQFADQTEQDWIASLSSGPPQALGPNATASEVSDYLTASTAYARQQQSQQERDERLAAEAAFNDPARSAAGWRPSGEFYNSRGQLFNGIIYNPSSAYRMDASGNLVPYSTQATPGSSGRPVTEETPDWMRHDYNKTQNPTAQSQNVSPNPASPSVQSPGTAQPIPPQSQGTPYWMNDPEWLKQQAMFANQPPEAYRPPTAEELAPVPQWNPTMPSQATTDRTYGFAPGERTTVYSGTDRQTSVPSAQFAFEQENWNQRAQDAVNRQAVYNAMNPARSQQLLAARGMGDDAFQEWSAYSGEDPRAGLSPSQSALDQIAQIRRNQQIRSDPISYYRELQAQGLV